MDEPTLGMDVILSILYAVLCTLPVSVLFIAISLLCGSVLNDKQVGGIWGASNDACAIWVVEKRLNAKGEQTDQKKVTSGIKRKFWRKNLRVMWHTKKE